MPYTHYYRAEHELDDGRLFSLQYACTVYPQTYWEPEDVDMGDPIFFIDGDRISEKDLPAEMTEQLIDRLIDRATCIEPEMD